MYQVLDSNSRDQLRLPAADVLSEQDSCMERHEYMHCLCMSGTHQTAAPGSFSVGGLQFGHLLQQHRSLEPRPFENLSTKRSCGCVRQPSEASMATVTPPHGPGINLTTESVVNSSILAIV
jgi:hypothetical protein